MAWAPRRNSASKSVVQDGSRTVQPGDLGYHIGRRAWVACELGDGIGASCEPGRDRPTERRGGGGEVG
jgi:hypothetical protein